MGTLYVVGTPIGNLEDITLRALEVLREADIIACEDTRRTGMLLRHYDIRKQLLSCRQQNQHSASRKVEQALQQDQQVAYVTDAGTPGLSDPGAVLVADIRSAGYPVVPVPGPSAFAALWSVGGVSSSGTYFAGFLSSKGGRRKRRLGELLDLSVAFVLYESPYRITKLLRDLAELDNVRRVVVGRELTKVHEEVLVGDASGLAEQLEARASIKGEITVLVGPGKRS
jgi:16S rRNA (cytidine1402-2'-O)-methyltransferase